MEFVYQAFNRDGGVASGRIESTSLQEASTRLIQQGLTPYELSEARSAKKGKEIPEKDFARFARSLGDLLTSGLDVDAALRLLRETETRGASAELVAVLHDGVLNGQPMSQVLASSHLVIPGHVQGMIKAGENSGKLGEVWGRLAELYERRLKSAEELRSALMYPGFLLVAALGSVIMILTVVVPSLKPVLTSLGSAPEEAVFLVGVSDGLIANWRAILFGVLLVLIGLLAWKRTEAGLLLLDRLALKLPLMRSLLINRESARFLQTSSVLLTSGVPLPDAISIAREGVTNAAFKHDLTPLPSGIRDGEPLSKLISKTRYVPLVVQRLVAVGEETGRLSNMMQQASFTLDEHSDRLQARFVSMLTPVLTLVLGGIVGSVVLIMLSAIMSVNDVGF